MSEARPYDVIVAGAGPAGLLAALAAGRAGLRVALLERKKDPGRLARLCGQTLVSANDYYFDDLVMVSREAGRISFPRSGLSFSYGGPVKSLHGWHIYAPGGGRLAFGDPAKTRLQDGAGVVGFAYDKEELLRGLLQQARDAGVEVHAGAGAGRVEQRSSTVRVEGGGRLYEGRYLIAADGANSRIARESGFVAGRTFYSYLLAKGFVMQGLKVPEPDILISGITYAAPAPGFMFLFPRPQEGRHMAAFLALEPAAGLDRVADWFMRESPFFSPWFAGARQRGCLASAQYVWSPVVEPSRGRVLLAGDAGSCQELENSGAMISGWRAGLAAAAAVQEEAAGIAPRALAGYCRWWRETYIDACPHEAYLMNFALPYVLDTEDDLNFLFSLAQEPLAPCWNPYAAVGLIGGLMQKLAPVIQQRRPALAEKLGRMQRPMTEVLARATEGCGPAEAPE